MLVVENGVIGEGIVAAEIVGVDGAKGRWLAVWRVDDGFRHAAYETPELLIAQHRSARVIAVDIPMGLTDSGSRPTDVLARRFVGAKRASSVFSAPVRGILDAASQAEASRCHRAIDGRGYGAQAFAILSHVRAWDSVLRNDEALRTRVYEIHPEVSFAAMNGGAGIAPSKKTREGARYRATLLCGQFGMPAVSNLVEQVSKGDADPDDVLDALAAFWSAQRIADGTAQSLPAVPVMDSKGLRIAIHY
jgi:predicted RNase H-like nuclease